MEEIEKMILELYNNENISIGVHGTAMLPDKEEKRVKAMCSKGIMCRYGDIRRTVALQDRGMIHAHGNASLEELMQYTYKKYEKGYVSEMVKEDKLVRYIPKEIDLEQYSFLVGIPKEMQTTDKEIFSGPKERFAMEYAKNEEDLRIGGYKDLEGRPINPQYIIGYYKNGDIRTFQYNSKFYGFQNKEKENALPELDLEKIQKVNEEVRQKNEEKIKKSTQELGKETIEEQKDTKEKRKIFHLFDLMNRKVRMNQSQTKEVEKNE